MRVHQRYSAFTLYAILLIALSHRVCYPMLTEHKHPIATSWDALGYYYYLPGYFIYDDLQKVDWLSKVDSRYHYSGGTLYQVTPLANGNKVGKYFVGVSIMQLPLFLVAHTLSKPLRFEADGFSLIYQYAISWGVFMYFLLALVLLRRVLLRHFDDKVVAVTLFLTVLATNALQYGAVEPHQVHAPIFLLYVLLLYATQRWHDAPNKWLAFLVGLICGVGTACRPTEAIMFLIPLFWRFDWQQTRRDKLRFLGERRLDVRLAILGGLIGFAPQVIYWHHVTGQFIYDVGSKWQFLNPFFRVLFGWEKGWFIYTPATIFFVIGLYFMKTKPFMKSVLVFNLVNIYIVISWFDWRYGASYSARALMQSYPVWALALASFVQATYSRRWFVGFWVSVCVALSAINIFQIWQYNKTILHYNDNNKKYYGRIFLNPNPNEYDVSLLDTQDWYDGSDSGKVAWHLGDVRSIESAAEQPSLLLDSTFAQLSGKTLAVDVETTFEEGFEGARLMVRIFGQDTIVKETNIRVDSPIAKAGRANKTACYVSLPKGMETARVVVLLQSPRHYRAVVHGATLRLLK